MFFAFTPKCRKSKFVWNSSKIYQINHMVWIFWFFYSFLNYKLSFYVFFYNFYEIYYYYNFLHQKWTTNPTTNHKKHNMMAKLYNVILKNIIRSQSEQEDALIGRLYQTEILLHFRKKVWWGFLWYTETQKAVFCVLFVPSNNFVTIQHPFNCKTANM